jgi:type IV pilus assembly protein PilW
MIRQQGFSLVELMVALILGLLVTLAAVGLFNTNQRSFQLQMALSEVQETGRFTLDYIARDLRKAGTPTPGLIRPNTIVRASIADNTNVDGTVQDVLVFQFYGIRDCEGDVAPGATQASPALITNRYDVRVNAEGVRELFCQGSVDAGSTGSALIAGVDSFQVLYGVDRSVSGGAAEDGVPFAGNYLKASQLGASDIVVAVRVGLLVRTEEEVVGLTESNVGFTVLDQVLNAGQGVLTEPRVRRLFTTTVAIRNQDWEEI